MKKLTIEEVKNRALSGYNLTLLDDIYINSRSPLKWKDNETGQVFSRAWSDITQGHVLPRNLNDYNYDKSFIEKYKNLGYKLLMDEEEYSNSERNNNGSRIFKIGHDELVNPLYLTLSDFKSSALSRLVDSRTSLGEYILECLLSNNNIKYEREKTFIINNHTHHFDFYLPNFNTLIEYDGEQHYRPKDYFGGINGYEKRLSRDYEKNLYAYNNGYKLIRIPYTMNSPKSISDYINSNDYGIHINSIEVKFSNKDIEIAKYYQSHSAKETKYKYGICPATAGVIYKRVFGKTKKSSGIKIEDVIDYCKNHSVSEATNYFKVSRSTIFIYKRKYANSSNR